MHRLARVVVSACCLVLPAMAQGTHSAPTVTFATLLQELVDLHRLTRLPDPEYRTVQFGSSDRRTVSPDQPGWFANADGFGQEPIPAFEKVLRAPGADGVGEYQVCDVEGPGAIVRGWSAGMDGVLRVWLDGEEKPLFEGKGYDFFARRTKFLLPAFEQFKDARLVQALKPQQDADYLPIPFAKGLRVTWTGRVRDLHFYHLQVRKYVSGTTVVPFTAKAAATVGALDAAPMLGVLGSRLFDLPIGGIWNHEHQADVPSSLQQLEFSIAADDMPRALRGVLLRIACDGAPVPQVEAPLGDYFASAPGLTPFDSAPLQVKADGTLVCRWVMPYRSTLRVELQNHSGIAVRGEMRDLHTPLANGFDDRTLYFHANWRVDHDLHAFGGKAPIDIPYLFAIGQGRLVGVACQICNPPMAPSWRSNWWGEGDERFAIDGVLSTFGTGTEDYFNYSWSHWQYFAHPFCGQPLSTGPGNCGYASNHRFQIVDDLPFAQSLALSMELWTHKEVHPLSYGRITYFYARPGVLTDHRALQAEELHVPKLAPWTAADLQPQGGSLHWRPGATEGGYRASGGEVEAQQPNAWTRSGAVLSWHAPAGGELELPFSIANEGVYRVRISCQQRPDAPAITMRVDNQALSGGEPQSLTCVHGQRFEDLVFEDVQLAAGAHTLRLSCAAGGTVGIDLVGYEPLPMKPLKLPGALEAELWDLVDKSPGVEVELQNLGEGWSSGHQRFVMCTAVGDHVTFRVPANGAGKQHVVLRLTTSRDYGIVKVLWNGAEVAHEVDLWGGPDRRIGLRELALGEQDLSQPVLLQFVVTGHAAQNEAPHVYFGVDCLLAKAK